MPTSHDPTARLVYARAGRPFQITQKGEAFQGHDISLDSLSTVIARIAKTPGLYVRSSIGVSDN
jgi:hypothetical protein